MRPTSHICGLNLRPKLSPLLSPNYTGVIEIGSSYGAYLKKLTTLNECGGIEQGREVAKASEIVFGRVLVGEFDYFESELSGGSLDLVICNDVVAHMADPLGSLKNLKRKIGSLSTLMESILEFCYLNVLIMPLLEKKRVLRRKNHGSRTSPSFF